MTIYVKQPLAYLTIALLSFTVVSPWLAAQGTGKTPIPDAMSQARGLKLVFDVLGDDIEKATTSDAKSRIATMLLQQGKEVKDDPAVRYACYREARELAAKAGDANLVLAVIDELNRSFDIDAMQFKAESLGKVVSATTEKDASLALVDVARSLLNEAVDLDHYKAADLLGEVAITAAKKARSPSLVLDLQKRMEDVKAIEKNFLKLHVYLERIKKNPDDGEANLELGKYFGYQKKRWEKALAYFALCNDASLAQLAKLDLNQPKDLKDQLALADGWWDRSIKEQNPAKLAIQMRAAHWYDKTLPALAGLNRTKAQKRIDIVQEQLSGSVVVQPVTGPVGEIKKFDGHTEEIKGVALSADGRYAASGARDTTVRIWDLATGKEAYILKGHTKEVWAIAFHPNNRYVLSASWDATVRMWDFKTGNEVKRWTHGKDVNSIVLSRDGSTMLTGCDDEKAYYWNVTTGEEIRKFSGHSSYVYSVAFAPDGRHIATGGVDKTVRYYDLNSGQMLKSFEGNNESVTNVAFTSDSRYILSSGDSVIHVWDTSTGKESRRIEGDAKTRHTGRIPAMAISPDGRRLATGSDDRTIKIWDVVSGKLLHTFAGHNDTITCIAFSVDGRRIVSGGYDRTVRVWNLPPR